MNEVNEEEDNLSMSDEEQKMEMSFGAKKMSRAAPQQQKKKEKGVFGKMADKVSQKMYKASKMN